MRTKTYKQISKGEFKKYDGYKCDFITDEGNKIKDGEIYIEDDYVFILSNDRRVYGISANNKQGYKYSWLIYFNSEDDTAMHNDAYKEITIYIPEETFEEGEEVYVSDLSKENALKFKAKKIFIYTDKNLNNICVEGGYEENYKEGKIYKTVIWKYAVKIPKEETIEIQTKDGQTLEISKDKAKELGFNIN